MRKILTSIMCVAVLSATLAGCTANTVETSDATSSETVATTTTTEATTTATTTDPTTTTTEDPRGHYEFKPVVISSIFRDIMGEDMCEAYANYVHAALKGEDTFEVKSEKDYDWMMGQFPTVCSPILDEYTESNYAGAYKDGKATFQYLIPKEEFAVKEAEFEKIVTDILNENLRDNYSDIEKVLALYIYFSENYTYDYDTYDDMKDRYIDNLSAYRFLTTDHGICCECAPAFSYLLLQAGVDAATVGGNTPRTGEGHSWSYVTINGKNYHVDPTYAMSSGDYLAYFMMTDEQRENEDGYQKKNMTVGCHYKSEHNGMEYTADDDFFAPLWGGYFTSFDPDKNLIYYTDSEGNDAVFDYSSFE